MRGRSGGDLVMDLETAGGEGRGKAKGFVLRMFRKKDNIRREGCKEGFYILNVVLFIEGTLFYPQWTLV